MAYVRTYHNNDAIQKLDAEHNTMAFDVVFETGYVRFYVRSSDVTVYFCRVDLKKIVEEFENKSIKNIPKELSGIFLDLNKICQENNEFSLTNYFKPKDFSIINFDNYKGYFWQNNIDKYSLVLNSDDVKISSVINKYPYPIFTKHGKSIVDIMIPLISRMMIDDNDNRKKLIEYAHNLLYVKIPNYQNLCYELKGLLLDYAFKKNKDSDTLINRLKTEYNDLAETKYDEKRDTCFTFLEYLSHVFSDDFRKSIKEVFFDAVMSRLMCDNDDVSKEYIKRVFKNKIVNNNDVCEYFVDVKEYKTNKNTGSDTSMCQMCMDETNSMFKQCKHPICQECLISMLFEKKSSNTLLMSDTKTRLCSECCYLEKNKNTLDDNPEGVHFVDNGRRSNPKEFEGAFVFEPFRGAHIFDPIKVNFFDDPFNYKMYRYRNPQRYENPQRYNILPEFDFANGQNNELNDINEDLNGVIDEDVDVD